MKVFRHIKPTKKHSFGGLGCCVGNVVRCFGSSFIIRCLSCFCVLFGWFGLFVIDSNET